MSITATQDITWDIAPEPVVGALSGSQAIEWSIDPFAARIGGFLPMVWRLSTSPEVLSLVLSGAPTGLTGILTVAIVTLDGSVYVYFPSTENITEVPADTGRYVATISRPNIGRYFVVWSDGATTVQTELFILPDSVVQTPLRMTHFAEYHLKAGDTEPSMMLTLRNAGGDPIDLAGAMQVNMRIRRREDDIPILDRPIVILEPMDEGNVVVDWLEGETDVPGVYVAEASIVWPTNGRSTAPSRATYRFTIEGAGV